MARPHHGYYLVDHTGTRRLPDRRWKPRVVELWHSPVNLELDPAYPGHAA